MDQEKYPFIEDEKKALIGAANGILLYDLFWPYLALIIIQLILGNNYNAILESNYHVLSLVLMIATCLFTLIASIFIARPKNILKSFDRFKQGDVKRIFSTLGVMLLFTFTYNVLIISLGVDAIGGNANQSNVIDLIYGSPTLAFISMIILAPVLEEVTYRYFVYGGISKYNRKLAIVLSGFIFMCVHATASFSQPVDDMFRELILLPPYMFSGMALAYSYDKTSNLAIPIAIHALNNLFSFIVCFL